MVVGQLTEWQYCVINMMVTRKALPMLNLVTKIQSKLPWHLMNLFSGVGKSKWVVTKPGFLIDWFIYYYFVFVFQVMLKRTNRPGITSSNRAPRGTRGGRGVRGARPFASFGFRPMRRPRFEWNDVNIDPPSQLINFNHSFLLVFSEEGGRLFLLHIKTRTCLLTNLVFATRDNLVGYINWDDGKKELMAE